VGRLEPAQEVASGGRVGDALRPQQVEVSFVVAQQFQVVDGSAPGQQVEGEVEDVVGFKVRDVPLEEMESAVEGSGQPQALDQQVKGPQASAVDAFGLGGHVVVDVLGLEHGATLLVPLLLAQPALDPALAIAEPLLYPGFHLKYLRPWGMGEPCHTPISLETPRYFKFFPEGGPPGAGETLVQGLDHRLTAERSRDPSLQQPVAARRAGVRGRSAGYRPGDCCDLAAPSGGR